MDLAEEKKGMKARKPDFIRTDAHKKKRLGSGWRKPKGYQNKMRLHKKGYRVMVKPGYGTPLRHTAAGLEIKKVATLDELKALNPKTEAAEIAKLGRLKKEMIIAEAKKLNIKIINLSVDKYSEKTKAIGETRKQKKADAEKKLEEAKKAEAKKKADEAAAKKKADEEKAAKEAESKSEDEVKAEEKKEKDKVLTSKKGY